MAIVDREGNKTTAKNKAKIILQDYMYNCETFVNSQVQGLTTKQVENVKAQVNKILDRIYKLTTIK